MKKIFIPILLFIFALFLLYIYLGNIGKELIVGTAPTLHPFTYLGGEHRNEVVGFDIELAKAIAKERGQKLKIEVMYFEQLLLRLQMAI